MSKKWVLDSAHEVLNVWVFSRRVTSRDFCVELRDCLYRHDLGSVQQVTKDGQEQVVSDYLQNGELLVFATVEGGPEKGSSNSRFTISVPRELLYVARITLESRGYKVE